MSVWSSFDWNTTKIPALESARNFKPTHLKKCTVPIHNRGEMGRGRSRFEVGEQQDIVTEAYAIPNNIKSTARKFNISPSQIRAWRKKLANVVELVSPKHKIFYPTVRKTASDDDVLGLLKIYLETQRAKMLPVSISSLCREARR